MKNRFLKVLLCLFLVLNMMTLSACDSDSSKNESLLSCTISISCESLLDNKELLPKEKRELVPENGWILEETEVLLEDGENVFDVLLKTCMEQKIHMEYSDVPLYNSAYIEGINNIYEFDAGNLSGWMYSVNDYFPNYGCSGYAVKDGDAIKWVYTCDLGEDVGGNNYREEVK